MPLATARPAPAARSRRAGALQPAVSVAAVFLAVAAGIHLAVVRPHLQEWLPAGLFFIALAAGQAGLAVLLVRRPGPLTVLAAIWSSLAVVTVYVWSRTSGLPFAPVEHGGHGAGDSQIGHAVGGHGNGVPVYPGAPSRAESVGGVDLVALGAELAVIALLVYVLPAGHRRWTSNGILTCGLALLALRFTGVLN
jgi:hypothetical protein